MRYSERNFERVLWSREAGIERWRKSISVSNFKRIVVEDVAENGDKTRLVDPFSVTPTVLAYCPDTKTIASE